MKKTLVVLGVIALVGTFICGAVLVGGMWSWRHWGGGTAGRGMMGIPWLSGRQDESQPGRGMMGGAWGPATQGRTGRGFGMMGGAWGGAACGRGQAQSGGAGCGRMGQGTGGMPCGGASTAGRGEIASLQGAQAALEAYVQNLGNANLQVTEVMEFERNYYAIVAEKDTGIGAMELLVDKTTGSVRPEMGPNMMWNAKYGMMGRRGMMGGATTGEMTLSAQQATDAAQEWLDANQPGRTAGQPDAFYGYYTFHYLKDGKVDGMLSVNGSSGAVWQHTWHGAFIAGTEGNQ